MAQIRKKTFTVMNDPVHGSIKLHPLCMKIIDTPEFQRLRYLKQLGSTYFVYPGASHNRFEHSIGVCHLAGKLMGTIRENQEELELNDRDILLAEIAGLCHDLGHGPFSHLFDGNFIPAMKVKYEGIECGKWKHEYASEDMLKLLIESNGLSSSKGLQDDGSGDGLSKDDVSRVRLLIRGRPGKKGRRMKECLVDEYKALRNEGKDFMLDVVANDRSGIDVDKWEYFARDCHNLGIKNNFDHFRCMHFIRVLKVNDENQICYRTKEAYNLYCMFHTRYYLHKVAYQHRVATLIDAMITDALIQANEHLTFKGKDGKDVKMSDAINDMTAYRLMTDDIFYMILTSTKPELEETRKLLEKIKERKLYLDIGTLPWQHCESEETDCESEETESDEIQKTKRRLLEYATLEGLEESKIGHKVISLDYGKGTDNPMKKVRFFEKGEDKAIELPKDKVSLLLPTKMSEKFLQLFYKATDISDGDTEKLKDAFNKLQKFAAESSPSVTKEKRCE